jgi:hypothetical protein
MSNNSKESRFFEPMSSLMRPELEVHALKEIDPTHYPVLANLKGTFGESTLYELVMMARYYKKHQDYLINKEGLYKPLTVIVVGIPGSGKSTIVEEIIRLYRDLGYDVEPVVSYEAALHEVHRDTSKDITYQEWIQLNTLLYVRLSRAYRPDYNDKTPIEMVSYPKKPVLRLGEMPGLSKYFPRENQPHNRDRGVSALSLLKAEMQQEHMFVLAVTGERSAQKKAVNHRKKLLDLSAEEQIAYLITHELLRESAALNQDAYKDKKVLINTEKLVELISSMAMPHHLEMIHKEFDFHKSNYEKRLIKETFTAYVKNLQLHLGREITEREGIILIEMLTFMYFLNRLGIPPHKIISTFNSFQSSLEGAFFQQLSDK